MKPKSNRINVLMGLCVIASAAACSPALGAPATPVVAPPAGQPASSSTAAPGMTTPVAQVRYVRAMQRGRSAFDRGEYPTALEAFKEALALRPNAADALDAMGQAQYRAGSFVEAQQSFQKAVDTGSSATRSRAAYHMGNALYKQGKLQESAEAYKRALRFNEKDDDARHNLQVVLDQLKQQKNDQQKNDQKQADNGKKNDQQKNDQKQADSGKKGDKQKGDQKQADNGKKGVAASGRPGQQGGMSTDDAARILQYYNEKERQAKTKSTPAAPYRPSAGSETW